MTPRENILQQIAALDADPAMADLRAELDDTREAIQQHELSIAKRRMIELANELQAVAAERYRQREQLMTELANEEPQQLRDLRTVLESAYERHRLSDPPMTIPGIEDPEFNSWVARGTALAKCAVTIRDLWKSPTWQSELAALVNQHRSVLPELRTISIGATNHAQSVHHQRDP